jgi:arginyl-tRNA synthetase
LTFPSIKYDMMEQIKEIVAKAFKDSEYYDQSIKDINIEIPNEKANGDFSSNIALVMAKKARTAPLRIAGDIAGRINTEGTFIKNIVIAGSGFINFFLSDGYLYKGLKDILKYGSDYGRLDIGNGRKVMVEFVSANPTGPLHMGNARGGALGDLIASVLEKAGYDVTREFFINDSGNQVGLFGKSLEARYIQYLEGEDAAAFPEDGYMGDDITAQARSYADTYGSGLLDETQDVRTDALIRYALSQNIGSMKAALGSYGISYDSWFSEQSLITSGELDKTLEYLDEKGFTYISEGAKWFRTTMFGGDKDDVLVRNNGMTTYFASDIAYHKNKFLDRGFDRVIDLLGADHHGHVGRMYSACEALGVDKNRLKIIVFQLVRLIKDGEVARMSKRTGKAISLEELIEETGRDAVRFFFNMKASGSHLDFDIDLAAKQSNENPVFYVQYAYARICSILRKADEDNVPAEIEPDLSLLCSEEEARLIDRLIDYPEEIRICACTLEPSRLTRYAIDIASLFHSFYNACRVIGEEKQLFSARFKLVEAVKTILGNVLGLMKIAAPERM